MKKININGQDYVKLRSLREEIRFLRKNIDVLYQNFDEDHRAMVHLAYNDIVRALYREELRAARTPEEHKAILEMPGEFIVCRMIGEKKSHKLEVFSEWCSGSPVISDCGEEALVFSYESKAQETVDYLLEHNGEGWHVLDISPEENDRRKRFWKAIFDNDDGSGLGFCQGCDGCNQEEKE